VLVGAVTGAVTLGVLVLANAGESAARAGLPSAPLDLTGPGRPSLQEPPPFVLRRGPVTLHLKHEGHGEFLVILAAVRNPLLRFLQAIGDQDATYARVVGTTGPYDAAHTANILQAGRHRLRVRAASAWSASVRQ
jgi:hypothetical protein